jgi:hypothetical protein
MQTSLHPTSLASVHLMPHLQRVSKEVFLFGTPIAFYYDSREFNLTKLFLLD